MLKIFIFNFRPAETAQDIFPQLDILTLSSNNNNCLFDSALREIINIIVSFDMGWSKRGNGRSYNNLNGYSTTIGFLSRKILDYTTRNRKCKKCHLEHKKDDHDCRLNFYGSAKAMEANAGVQLINHSNILKELGLKVRVIIGDEDSSMIAAVRASNLSEKFLKLADKNHLTKNFAGELYKIRNKFKELNKKDVILHIKKCFFYAVSQNKSDFQNLAKNLEKYQITSSAGMKIAVISAIRIKSTLFTHLMTFYIKSRYPYSRNTHQTLINFLLLLRVRAMKVLIILLQMKHTKINI